MESLEQNRAPNGGNVVWTGTETGSYAQAADTITLTFNSVESTIRKARQNLKNVDAKNETNKKFIRDFTTKLEKIEEMLPKVVEMKSDYKKYDSNYMSEFYDSLTAIQKPINEWTSGIQKIAEEGEIRDELNNLGTILVNKVNK